MDIPRIGYRQKKWRRNVSLLLLAAALVTGVSIFVARLEPALPAVDRSSVWIDTVSRGPLIRDVRGIGTLVPEDVRCPGIRSPAEVSHPALTIEEPVVEEAGAKRVRTRSARRSRGRESSRPRPITATPATASSR